MKYILTILYIIMWVIFITLSLYLMRISDNGFAIIVIPLLGVGGWLYGSYIGLHLVLISTLFHFVLMSVLHGDQVLYYQNRLIGTIISISVVLLTGHMRKNIDNIKKTNRKLDLLIAKKTNQLDTLATQLITESEERRINISQILHDGFGQQMTGIQLYSSSLSNKLLQQKKSLAAISSSLNKSGNTVHNQIRQIARMMFPVKIGNVGLLPALDELASCYSDLEHMKFTIKESGFTPPLPEKKSLQLYRISQEMANHCINQLGAQTIRINVSSNIRDINLELKHDGMGFQDNVFYESLLLINYRLQLIEGSSQINMEPDSTQTITFSTKIP